MGLHRVHPDTVARPFDAKRLGEIAKRPSGGGLVRAQRLFGRADKDNRPAAPRRAAMGGEILRQQEALIEPGIKRRAPLIMSKLVRGHVPRLGRDVDQHVAISLIDQFCSLRLEGGGNGRTVPRQAGGLACQPAHQRHPHGPSARSRGGM